MYDFHYNTWMKKFPNSRLLFNGTDSLVYEVVGHDLYAGMAEIKDEIDFSEYPKNHFLQSYDNTKVVGKLKDECKGQLVLRFVGRDCIPSTMNGKHISTVKMELKKKWISQ